MLGFALLTVSCSKDGNPPVNQEINATQKTNLKLSMEVGLDEEELRNAMIVKPKTTPNWQLILPTLKEGDVVPLKLAFSNGATLDHHTVDFKYTGGKLKFSGEVAVTGYTASGDVTRDQWYVMAFLGGAKEGNYYAYAPQVQPLSLTEQFTLGGDLNIPFISRWTPIQRSGADEGYFSVSLKPFGYFMRVQVVNERDHELGVYGFQVESDKYLTNIKFNLPYERASLQAGAYPIVEERAANNILPVGGNLLTKGGSGDGTKSRVFGIWVMPKQNTTATETIKLYVIHRYNGGNWKFPFNVTVPATASGLGGNQGLKTLKVKNDHKIHRPLHTIDYVALGNLDQSGTELAEGQKGHLFVLERTNNADNKKLTLYSNPRPITERLMTITDWENILPRSNTFDIANRSYHTPHDYNGAATRDGQIFFATSGNFSLTNGDSFVSSGNVLYAVRTVDSHKAAFRYTLNRTTGDLKVEMVHLGTTSGKTISDVAKESYWQFAERYGEVVTRTFAGTGSITHYLGVYDKGITNGGNERKDGQLGGTVWNTSTGRVGLGIDEGGVFALQGHTFGRQARQRHTVTPLDIPAKL